MRGHVILPGETFSVNGFVGKRTADRGFVDAPVIYNATEAHDIGGGVSQFATTMFNASFFAGLDLVEYQSHSIYISRYPRGREATISWPAPDLKVKNSSPYGILLWPTYDETTLTVHMYSTHYVDVTGLQAGVNYFFDVVSGGVVDNNAGQHYQIKTAAVTNSTPQANFVRLTIRDVDTRADQTKKASVCFEARRTVIQYPAVITVSSADATVAAPRSAARRPRFRSATDRRVSRRGRRR